jgi:hypothetical protein
VVWARRTYDPLKYALFTHPDDSALCRFYVSAASLRAMGGGRQQRAEGAEAAGGGGGTDGGRLGVSELLCVLAVGPERVGDGGDAPLSDAPLSDAPLRASVEGAGGGDGMARPFRVRAGVYYRLVSAVRLGSDAAAAAMAAHGAASTAADAHRARTALAVSHFAAGDLVYFHYLPAGRGARYGSRRGGGGHAGAATADDDGGAGAADADAEAGAGQGEAAAGLRGGCYVSMPVVERAGHQLELAHAQLGESLEVVAKRRPFVARVAKIAAEELDDGVRVATIDLATVLAV